LRQCERGRGRVIEQRCGKADIAETELEKKLREEQEKLD
jgi:hypothetical protein